MAFEATSPIRTINAAASRERDTFNGYYPSRPQAMTAYLRFIERGTIESTTATTEGLLFIGSLSVAPRFIVFAQGGVYRAIHQNSFGGSATAVLAAAPVVGDMVELVAQLAADGTITLYQSINGAVPTSAASAVTARVFSAIGWAAKRLFLGNGPQMITGLRNAVIVRGVKDLTQMRKRAGVI